MKVTKVVVGCVIASGLVACGPIGHHKRKFAERPVQPTKSAEAKVNVPAASSSTPSTVCATVEDVSLDPAKPVQRQKIQLQRTVQKTIRKNCEGQVISQNVETVDSPKAEIEIKPASNWLGFRQSYSTVFNRTTCSNAGAQLEKILALMTNLGVLSEVRDELKSATGFPSLRLWVDTSPSLSHMRVSREKENYIDYEFGGCDEYTSVESGKKVCSKPRVTEKGTLILTVEDSEKQLPGEREIVDCPSAQKQDNQ